MVIFKTTEDVGLPKPGMDIDPQTTAIVMTDPQIDFLSPNGVAWDVVGKSVTQNGTVGNLLKLFQVAKQYNIPVYISPHYYYPHDHKKWKFAGALEEVMHDLHMFDRTGTVSTQGFEGSGADWMEEYKPFIKEDNVVVCHAHKVR